MLRLLISIMIMKNQRRLYILDSEIIPELEVTEIFDLEEVELVDPDEVVVKALKAQLRTQIIDIESNLNDFSKIKDKASESGKNG